MDPFSLLLIIGLNLLMRFLMPGPKPLDSVAMTQSALGVAIPYVKGDLRLGGNLFWGSDVRLVEVKEKGGTVDHYFQDLFFGLCEGPIQGVTRIWADDIVIYDARIGGDAINTYPDIGLTVYPGTEDQQPDPTMESVMGVGGVPAYRGIGCITMTNVPLHKFSWRIPVLNFETVAGGYDNTAVAIQRHPYRTGFVISNYYDFPTFIHFYSVSIRMNMRIDEYSNMAWVTSPDTDTEGASYSIKGINLTTGSVVVTAELPSSWVDTTMSVPGGYGGEVAGGYAGVAAAWTGNWVYAVNLYGTDGVNTYSTCDILRYSKSDLSLAETYTGIEYTEKPWYSGCNAAGTIFVMTGRNQHGSSDSGTGGSNYPYIHVLNIAGDSVRYWDHNARTAFGVHHCSEWQDPSFDEYDDLGGITPMVFDKHDNLFLHIGTFIYKMQVNSDATLTRLDRKEFPVGSGIFAQFALAIGYDPLQDRLIVTYNTNPDDESQGRTIIYIDPVTFTDVKHVVIPPYTDDPFIVATTENGWYGQWTTQSQYLFLWNNGDATLAPAPTDCWAYIVDFRLGTWERFDYGITLGQPYFIWSGSITWINSSTGLCIGTSDYAAPDEGDGGTGFVRPYTYEGQELVTFRLAGNNTLQQVCEDVCTRVGLTTEDFDFSAFGSVNVKGVICSSRKTIREFLGELVPAYFFDVIERDWKLTGVLRKGLSSVVTINEDDVVDADQGGGFYEMTYQNPLELPPWVDVTYYDDGRDLTQGSQPSRLPNSSYNSSASGTTVNLPVVFTADEARTAGQIALDATWSERDQYNFALSQKYLKYEPSDVITLQRKNQLITTRMQEGNINPTTMQMDCKHSSFDPDDYNQATITATDGSWFESQKPVKYDAPYVVVIDTALMRTQDDHVGLYLSAAPSAIGDRVANCDVLVSADGVTYADTGVVTQGVPAYGFYRAGNPAPTLTLPYTVFDADTSIVLEGPIIGTWASHSKDELLADPSLNLIWLGGQLCQYASASAVALDGSITLTGFLWGRFGTEKELDFANSLGDVMQMTESVCVDVTFTAPEIGAERWYNVKDVDHGLEGPAPEQVDNACRRLLCPAPIWAEWDYARDGGGTLTAPFIFRSRTQGKVFQRLAPFGTEMLSFECDVYNGASVVRTIKITPSSGNSYIDVTTDPYIPRVIYSGTDQVADFGSHQSQVTMIVYQMNSIHGRGYGQETTA
jgi:hypothetical protein